MGKEDASAGNRAAPAPRLLNPNPPHLAERGPQHLPPHGSLNHGQGELGSHPPQVTSRPHQDLAPRSSAWGCSPGVSTPVPWGQGCASRPAGAWDPGPEGIRAAAQLAEPTLELGNISLKKVGSQDSRMKKEQAAESWEKMAALRGQAPVRSTGLALGPWAAAGPGRPRHARPHVVSPEARWLAHQTEGFRKSCLQGTLVCLATGRPCARAPKAGISPAGSQCSLVRTAPQRAVPRATEDRAGMNFLDPFPPPRRGCPAPSGHLKACSPTRSVLAPAELSALNVANNRHGELSARVFRGRAAAWVP